MPQERPESDSTDRPADADVFLREEPDEEDDEDEEDEEGDDDRNKEDADDDNESDGTRSEHGTPRAFLEINQGCVEPIV